MPTASSAVISFLNASYDAQVYSTPRVVTLDNVTAHIEVIRTYPIISLSGSTANTGGSASVTYSNIGTILDVTPRISANDNIWLNVIPEVSSLLAMKPSPKTAAARASVPPFRSRFLTAAKSNPKSCSQWSDAGDGRVGAG